VDYVGFFDQDYSKDIETREKAGTPPILQTIKTALAMEVKGKVGTKVIEKIENRNKTLFFDHFRDHKKIEIIGVKDPDKRIPIISFNIKHLDKYFHPRFVTRLLSDLFGILSRAGCSCAGPYGHRLLHITNDISQRYRKTIVEKGITGVKPGWVRVNLHWVFTEKDVEFIIDAVEFIAKYGDRLLKVYNFDPVSADWKHIGQAQSQFSFGLDSDFDIESINISDIGKLRKAYMKKAADAVSKLSRPSHRDYIKYERRIEELKYFYHCNEKKPGDK